MFESVLNTPLLKAGVRYTKRTLDVTTWNINLCVLKFSFSTIFAKSFILDLDNILSSSLMLVTTCGKSSISAVWLGFEFTFVLIIFAKLFPICLLNLINISNHISVLCTVKSTWPCVQHISLKFALSLSKKICLICLFESPLQIMKNAFYFILKHFFILKIF